MEEEIETLRLVLASKIRSAHELKRKLGISVWKEFQDDMSQSIRNVKESNVLVYITLLLIFFISFFYSLSFLFYKTQTHKQTKVTGWLALK